MVVVCNGARLRRELWDFPQHDVTLIAHASQRLAVRRNGEQLGKPPLRGGELGAQLAGVDVPQLDVPERADGQMTPVGCELSIAAWCAA
jgi:hypothetical protein